MVVQCVEKAQANPSMWRNIETKDAANLKVAAQRLGNLEAAFLAASWLHAIEAAPAEAVEAAAAVCRSIAPEHRQRAIAALERSGGRR